MGQQGPPAARIFFKNGCGPHGMPKQVLLARFEHVVARYGPPKSPQCLENGLFWGQKEGQKWVKNVFFQKKGVDHLGCLQKKR